MRALRLIRLGVWGAAVLRPYKYAYKYGYEDDGFELPGPSLTGG
jgi:hypothetical protein